MRLMLFALIASVLSRVAHKKLLASEKTDHTLWHGRAKNKVRRRDGALREFDILPILHIKHQNVLRPWALKKPPVDSRNAMREYVVLV